MSRNRHNAGLFLAVVLGFGVGSMPLAEAQVGGEVTRVADAPSVSAIDLLKESDYARGGDIDGLRIESTITAFQAGEKQNSYSIVVESDRNNSLVTFVAPAHSKGVKMLIQGRNMWFLSPDVKKPVPISPRQRLLGEANNGDIATVNYSRDYEPEIVDQDVIDGKPCHVVVLKAKGSDVMYNKIVYYIDKSSRLGVKAEYYGASDKLLKTAMLQYDNAIEYAGRRVSFVSRMEIMDAIRDKEKTVLEYVKVEANRVPATRFDRRLLMKN